MLAAHTHPVTPVGRRLRAVTADDAGFSLLEVLVSFVLFSIVAAVAMSAIVSALNTTHSSQQRVDAANVAQSFLASMQANPSSALTGTTSTVNGVTTYTSTFSASVTNEQFSVQRTASVTSRSTCTHGVPITVSITASIVAKNTTTMLARSDSVITC